MKAEQLMSTCSQQQISQIDYLTCCNLTSRVSTRSFLGLSFKSGTLRRMEQRPPRPSYEQTPAHLKTYTLSHPCWLFQVRVAKGKSEQTAFKFAMARASMCHLILHCINIWASHETHTLCCQQYIMKQILYSCAF